MVHINSLAAAAASLLLLPSTCLAAGLYTKKSAVLNVDARSYDSLIAKSNYTSIVEFYAPWCGHCQNLKPAYEKAAESLKGQAKVAAVNCDDEENKQFCGSMGVKGFPTLKIVRPGKLKENGRRGRPAVEDYQGARSAKAIVDVVRDKMVNHVKRLKDGEYESWVGQGEDRPKAILFSDKGTVSALIKAVAIDFLGVVDVAQIRDKEKQACEAFGVKEFPSLVLLPGSGKEAVTFDGSLEKSAIVKFLSQAAEPNPDPAPSKKASKSPSGKKEKSASSKFSKASASQASSEAASGAASQTAETLEDSSNPTESPNPRVQGEQKPIKVPDEPAPPISSLHDGLSLQQKCLNDKAGTCILLLLPEALATEATIRAVMSLSEIHHKHEQSGRNLFPFYQLPTTNSQASALRRLLKLSDDAALIATNGKRAWYREYPSETYTYGEIESWIDSIRMGEGKKEKLSTNLIIPASQLPTEPVEIKMEDDNIDAMRAAWKQSMPEGVDVDFEEIDDVEYEAMMKAAEKRGQEEEQKKKQQQQQDEHDEL
ncbi:thioredoxin-domain-containing protein [Polychaeton citri CBS 116435]|uniref:protein disulfide-isomerase n=1 Tax=Polychaeton citri CBS 116435 TaxID=1314669 RepID=A0A9P4US28_9PEZI|nr:thioredoxin-domain-containing protein [Polychaeton citri CBS 116435]